MKTRMGRGVARGLQNFGLKTTSGIGNSSRNKRNADGFFHSACGSSSAPASICGDRTPKHHDEITVARAATLYHSEGISANRGIKKGTEISDAIMKNTCFFYTRKTFLPANRLRHDVAAQTMAKRNSDSAPSHASG